jgi:Fe-S-cluster containining protein
VAHVYVNYEERQRLADFLDLDLATFNRTYTRLEEDGHRNLKFVEDHCIFLEEGTCTVHEAKPTQCRTWPFWEELLESPEAYREQVLDFCPGSEVTEPVVSAESIRAQMVETEEALRDD